MQDDQREVAELRELHARLTEREAALEASAAAQQQELQAAQVHVLSPILRSSTPQWPDRSYSSESAVQRT